MDLTKLESISTDALVKIQAAVKEILDTRLDRSMVRGRIGEFKDKNGSNRIILIQRVNRESVSGVEIRGSIEQGKKWRVGKGAITMQAREVPGAKARPFVPAYVPATETVDHW